MVGESAMSWRLRADIAFAGAADAHTLILGESGVGKELVARAVHRVSARAEKPWVARSAASFPSTLVDAELFGNMRNFPNPGMPERPGLVGAADGGVLFLDEIGELTPDVQAHLLRVLDAGGEYHRLGEAIARRSNLRLIAATNRGISALKADLAARFTLRIEVANVNQRKEDIPLLVQQLMERARVEAPSLVSRFFSPSGTLRVQPDLVEALLQRNYTLNTREIEELLWRAAAESRGDCLELGQRSREKTFEPTPPPIEPAEPSLPPSEAEIRRVLQACRGSTSLAYRRLNLSSRYALYRLMRKYGIAPTSFDR
jgi:DNA-binding NtrC family response regulator